MNWQAYYPLIMLAALLSGAWISRRYKSNLAMSASQKIWLGLCAFGGAMLAARLPFLFPGVPGIQGQTGLLISGKTILLGLVGGYAGVEWGKWSAGIKTKTGDAFVVPVAVSVGIGRIACFLGGCCYGVPTNMPWGVTFSNVDMAARHPTQLYEAAFHFSMAAVCAVLFDRKIWPRQLIKFYFLSYFVFRFLTEFLRPEERIVGGITVYQWICAAMFGVFLWLWQRDANSGDRLSHEFLSN
ncbi:MAG: prolipoprotein diacylglyceryl transferase [Planctomycetales bacterium]|nr:prolipoprotein diacylglyceryl transferase [Planctomycetales bacterium]